MDDRERLAGFRVARGAADLAHLQQLMRLGYWRLEFSGHTMDGSEELLHLLGFAPEDFSLERFLAQVPADDRPDLRHALGHLMEEGAPFEMVHSFERAGGGRLRILTTARLCPSRTGERPIVFGACLDITDRAFSHSSSPPTFPETVGAARLLAGGVAHDLNNLLTPIIGHADLLGETELDTSQRESLAAIVRVAESARDLVQKLTAFGQKQMLSVTSLSVNQVIEESYANWKARQTKDVQVALRLDPAARPVRGDRAQLEQVLISLMDNARDAMPGGGQMTITTGNTALTAGFSSLWKDLPVGEYTVLTVSDTGVGMDLASMARVFEPFFTTKPLGNGCGLSLAAVYGIVRQHGGEILVDSQIAEGSCFAICLPSEKVMAPVTKSKLQEHDYLGRGETVLVVEDEDIVRQVASTMLDKLGYNVLSASDAFQAYDLVEKHPEINLLLTDVMMPGQDGPALYTRVHALRPKMGVVFMSGYTSNALAKQGILEEGTAFVAKPFRRLSLALKLREVLNGQK